MHSRIFEVHSDVFNEDSLITDPDELIEDAQSAVGADYVDWDKDFKDSLQWLISSLTQKEVDNILFGTLLKKRVVKKRTIYEMRSLHIWIQMFQERYIEGINVAKKQLTDIAKTIKKGGPIRYSISSTIYALKENSGMQYVIDGTWANQNNFYDHLLQCHKEKSMLLFVQSWDYHC